MDAGFSRIQEMQHLLHTVISKLICATGAMGDFATVSMRVCAFCSRTIRVLTQCDHAGPARSEHLCERGVSSNFHALTQLEQAAESGRQPENKHPENKHTPHIRHT